MGGELHGNGSALGGTFQELTLEQELLSELGPPSKDTVSAVVLTIVYVLVFLSGSVGNICTCIVIARNHCMQTSTNYYLFSLALSDLLLLFFGLPPELYTIWMAYPWSFGEAFCYVRSACQEVTSYASVLTITAFTVERYIAVSRPLLSHKIALLSRTVKIIVGIWVVSLLVALPYAAHTRLYHAVVSNVTGQPIPESLVCSIPKKWLEGRMAYMFQISTFLFFLAPVTVIMCLYILIGLAVRRSPLSRGSSDEQSHSQLKHAPLPQQPRRVVIRMLVAVTVAFIICWAPFHAQRLMVVYVSNWTPELLATYSHIFYISGVLYFVSATVNPILYNVISRRYRVAFRQTICGPCNRLRARGGSGRQRLSSTHLQRTLGIGGGAALGGGGGPQGDTACFLGHHHHHHHHSIHHHHHHHHSRHFHSQHSLQQQDNLLSERESPPSVRHGPRRPTDYSLRSNGESGTLPFYSPPVSPTLSLTSPPLSPTLPHCDVALLKGDDREPSLLREGNSAASWGPSLSADRSSPRVAEILLATSLCPEVLSCGCGPDGSALVVARAVSMVELPMERGGLAGHSGAAAVRGGHTLPRARLAEQESTELSTTSDSGSAGGARGRGSGEGGVTCGGRLAALFHNPCHHQHHRPHYHHQTVTVLDAGAKGERPHLKMGRLSSKRRKAAADDEKSTGEAGTTDCIIKPLDTTCCSFEVNEDLRDVGPPQLDKTTSISVLENNSGTRVKDDVLVICNGGSCNLTRTGGACPDPEHISDRNVMTRDVGPRFHRSERQSYGGDVSDGRPPRRACILAESCDKSPESSSPDRQPGNRRAKNDKPGSTPQFLEEPARSTSPSQPSFSSCSSSSWPSGRLSGTQNPLCQQCLSSSTFAATDKTSANGKGSKVHFNSIDRLSSG